MTAAAVDIYVLSETGSVGPEEAAVRLHDEHTVIRTNAEAHPSRGVTVILSPTLRGRLDPSMVTCSTDNHSFMYRCTSPTKQY
jgi:hypothetical protein